MVQSNELNLDLIINLIKIYSCNVAFLNHLDIVFEHICNLINAEFIYCTKKITSIHIANFFNYFNSKFKLLVQTLNNLETNH